MGLFDKVDERDTLFDLAAGVLRLPQEHGDLLVAVVKDVPFLREGS